MISATFMIVGFVTLVTLGFTLMAITMYSRGRKTEVDINNINDLMSYSVIDNHTGYDENNDEYYDEEETVYSNYTSYSNQSDRNYTRDIMAGPAEFLKAVNHNHIKRPAYLHFR